MEFGPVTFPANPDSTSGIRALTDEYYGRARSRNPQAYDELVARAQQLRIPAVTKDTGTQEKSTLVAEAGKALADAVVASEDPAEPVLVHSGAPTSPSVSKNHVRHTADFMRDYNGIIAKGAQRYER
jgi:hypothetical protein